jgi:Family of unknown function (DUF6527)
MVKLLRMIRKDGTQLGYMHWCPACDEHHAIYVEEVSPKTGIRHTFNNDPEHPTFNPSIRASAQCHYLIKDGVIEYLPDCLHLFAGKVIEMPKGDIC